MSSAPLSSSGYLVLSLLLIVRLLSFCSQSICGNVVTHLPGFTGQLPFHLETGYVGIDESNDTQLFYYFIESEGNPREDPLLLWLTGGPGCSGFSGLVFEIGPLRFNFEEYDGSFPTLCYFPDSWTKVSSIIFLDSPVGTGFSFSKKPAGYEVSDTIVSKQVLSFLRKWFNDHRQYLGNHFYITGDSYSGKIVPIVVHEMLKGIEAGQKLVPNFKGYSIGNPVTGEKNEFNAQIPYARNMGIISDELYQMTITKCKGEDYFLPKSSQCALLSEAISTFFDEINNNNILDPYCPELTSKHEPVLGYRRLLEDKHSKIAMARPAPSLGCRNYPYHFSYIWANNEAVRQAIGIQEGSVEEWVRCNYSTTYTKDIKSTVVYQKSILSRGYRALVYSGDHDLLVPFIGTVEWIKSLNSSIVDHWRSWHVGGQVAGYTRTYANKLTFATVKGAGHTAPEYKPKECLAMIARWLSQKPL